MIKGTIATLLPFDSALVPLVRGWINDEEVRRGTGTEGPVSDVEHERWYRSAMDDRSQRIFVMGMGAGADAKPVGLIGLRGINWRARSAEYWIYLGEDSAKGKGIAYEASRLLLSFAFRRLGLNRIFLHVDATNERAIGLYKKLGFAQEGICRSATFVDGKYLDRILFAILADEYNEVAVQQGDRNAT
jgi:RimJ/RimL family protein N-acetyltransferase